MNTHSYCFVTTRGKLVGSKYDLPVDAAGVQVHVFDTVTLTWTQPTTTVRCGVFRCMSMSCMALTQDAAGMYADYGHESY